MGFGYSCSDDGLQWSNDSALVKLEGGARTPYGLLALTADEMAAHRAKILSYGVLPPERFGAANTSLQWAFYTAETTTGPCWGKWESFRVAIVGWYLTKLTRSILLRLPRSLRKRALL